jgi:hypothetical protein
MIISGYIHYLLVILVPFFPPSFFPMSRYSLSKILEQFKYYKCLKTILKCGVTIPFYKEIQDMYKKTNINLFVSQPSNHDKKEFKKNEKALMYRLDNFDKLLINFISTFKNTIDTYNYMSTIPLSNEGTKKLNYLFNKVSIKFQFTETCMCVDCKYFIYCKYFIDHLRTINDFEENYKTEYLKTIQTTLDAYLIPDVIDHIVLGYL